MTRPFLVQVSPGPLFSSGGDVDIVASFAVPVPAGVVPEVDGLVDAFCMLASTGGLSGARIRPSESDIRGKSDVDVRENVLHWRLTGCRVDERSLTCLLNLFEFIHARCPVRQLDVFPPGPPKGQLQPISELGLAYPAQPPSPFRVIVNEPIAETVTLTMQFATALDADQIEEVESTLLTWSVAPSVGAFAAPDAEVERSSMIADPEVEVFGNEVTWGIEKFRMHVAAVDSLVNCCVAMADRVAPVVALELS